LARFNQIFEEVMEEHGIAGGTIAVAKDGRLLLARGHGLADVEAGQRVTNKTLFSLASVTKSVSAVAALRLADQGRLNLERRLVDVLADLGPPAGQGIADPRFRDITVHQLLYHGSGLAHSTVRPEGNRGDNDEDEGDDDLVAVYRNALTIPLEFTPGTEHRYSNVGFLILRLVIERAAGQAYEPFVCQRILQPMGITDMVMERPEPIAGETKRYIVGPEGRRPARHIGHNWLATPTDMIKFLTALTGTRGQRFLSRRMTALMLAVPPPPIQPARDGRHVGLGWDTVRAVDGDHRFSKNGGKPGVSAWIEHLPGNVDWAFMLNTSVRASDKPGGPSAPSELIRRVDEVIEATTQWPQRDLF
jgi:N-acyl-D-amino-acid deacylase